MDLRHMRHFVAVAEELHFGKAALRLNMAQPPLSQSIRRLEVDLGVELFDRSRRGVALTDAGGVFLEEARRTLVQANLACKMAQRQAAKAPEVRVSFIGPALFRVLPDLIVRYRAAAPEVHVRLFERASPDQTTGIVAGDFDIGFVTAAGDARTKGCETLVVERSRFVAAVPADWPIARSASVTLAELADQPFIMPPQQYASHWSETVAIFKEVGVMPRIAQEATQTTTTLSLVGAGLGCSLVMATAALMQTRNVRFLTVAEDAPHARWELLMTWRPDQLGKPASDFLRFARNHVRDNPHLTDTDAPIA